MTPLVWIVSAVGCVAVAALAYLLVRERKRHADAVEHLDSRLSKVVDERDGHAREALRLRERDAWRSSVLDNACDMLVVYRIDEDGVPGAFCEVNNLACRTLGYTREQLLDLAPRDIEVFHLPDGEIVDSAEPERLTNPDALGQDSEFARRTIAALVGRVLEEGTVAYEGRYVTRAGQILPVGITAHASERGGERLIVCVSRDVSAERHLRRQLRDREQLLRDMLARAPIGIAMLSPARRVLSANPACLEIFGCADSEAFARLELVGDRRLDFPPVMPDGESDVASLEMSVELRELSLQTGVPLLRDGVIYIRAMLVDLGVDEHVRPRGKLLIVEDASDVADAREGIERRDRKLQQAQRLEALGLMAGGIAHDFNNILTPILGYADLARSLSNESDPMYDFMGEVLESCRRAKQLVDQIKLFTRQGDEGLAPLRLGPMIKEAAKQVAGVIPENVKIQCGIHVEDDMVLATPTQVHQVLINLYTNAGDAMVDGGGTLSILFDEALLDEGTRAEFPRLQDALETGSAAARYARISVSDTGCGMAPDELLQVFDPSYSTKQKGARTGMGLAVVQGIVTSLGGAVSVESEVGEGSAFSVILPLIDSPESTAELPEVVPDALRRRILFVDDEPAIVRLAGHMLDSLGYEAICTVDPHEALELFKRRPGGFDLLIADQVMYAMTGLQLAAELRALRPDLPVMLCSGFAEKIDRVEAARIGINHIIVKPVDRKGLAAAIADTWASARSGVRSGGEGDAT